MTRPPRPPLSRLQRNPHEQQRIAVVGAGPGGISTAIAFHRAGHEVRLFEANAFIRPLLEGVFANEDKPMLEMQQRRIGGEDFWSLQPVLLPADAGAARVRRKLRALIDAEAAK